MSICPKGHQSSTDDYCSVCGIAMGPSPVTAVPAPATVTARQQNCPFCGMLNGPDVLFCEACGYDFTTGAKPQAFAAAKAVLDLDAPVPAAPQSAIEPEIEVTPPAEIAAALPTAAPPPNPIVEEPQPEQPANAEPGFSHVAEVWIDPSWYSEQQSSDPMPSPGLPALVPLTRQTLVVGRASKSKNVVPDIDCGTDTGCSRRQSEITTDGYRWWITDLDSANGTYVGAAGAVLPATPITRKTELNSGDRIYVGAWTRIVIRPATPDELTALKED